ncbi:NAD(P)-dependent oxidoreductase [Arthrobacter sp.]|uniref:NAD-dependent epimerase/dehydratase family protein n=1 Tax=Arthrobacter sp. TaxID=1667 RepID=UPI0026DFE797|nr:NAD-dependent epimerase/dehydratase family protein [Arthrobacter sp.]MDO5751914.1 NAD-dependent epimerase/dehydratase family protein [Arthrobacter sp.]
MGTDDRARGLWVVLGASGFVGSAVVAELRGRGIEVLPLAAPRLRSEASNANALLEESRAGSSALGGGSLVEAFAAADVVVNAAGLATPGGGESAQMTGANALLPAVVAWAAHTAGVRRVVHLSSASVQGHRRVIDESSDRAPFSPYSRSKALGEEVLELLAADSLWADSNPPSLVTIRATSVQGPSRPTTLALAKISRSPLASVASPGTAATPVSSIAALAWFVAEAGLHASEVPSCVIQPWEGLSVSDVLAAAGGRRPLRLPAWLCRTTLKVGYLISRLLGERLHGPIRRVELMWFGQSQSPGWAEAEGLTPTPGVHAVLEQARTNSQTPSS